MATKGMQQYIKVGYQLEKRIENSRYLQIGLYLLLTFFLYMFWVYYIPPYHPIYICFWLMRAVTFPYILLTWFFRGLENKRAPTPEAFLIGEIGQHNKDLMNASKGWGGSIVGATFVGAAILGGYAYLSQQRTADGLRYSTDKSGEKAYSYLTTVKGSNDAEIAKRARQLLEQSKEFSTTTSRLVSDTSTTSLFPKNIEVLRIYAEKGHQLRDEAAQLVVDQYRLDERLAQELRDTAPPVSPGSPLENISCDGSTSLIQEFIGTLLAKISLL